jgi:hypothetical protein
MPCEAGGLNFTLVMRAESPFFTVFAAILLLLAFLSVLFVLVHRL